MDPQVVWKRMLSALEVGNIEEAADAAGDLVDWLDRLGFPPQISSDYQLPDAWCRVVSRAACEVTLEMANRPTS